MRIAWDAVAKLIWVQVDGSPWNADALADPVAGVGGLSTASMVGAGFLGVTLLPVIGAGARYRVPGDAGYLIPTGYSEMAS